MMSHRIGAEPSAVQVGSVAGAKKAVCRPDSELAKQDGLVQNLPAIRARWQPMEITFAGPRDLERIEVLPRLPVGKPPKPGGRKPKGNGDKIG